MTLALYLILGLCMFAPIYTYILYPILLKLLPGKQYKVDEEYRPTVSVIIAAYNEAKVIAEKIENLASLQYPQEKIEFLIGSDGSSDDTVKIARSFSHLPNLKVLDLPRGGKTSTLNALLKEATGEVIVFSDANTMYDSSAILHLVKHYRDQRIGCVSGQMRYQVEETAGHGAKSESAYWKYENWVKVQESKLGRLSGANGAIYSIRKGILTEIKKGIINDDFYVATFVLQAGYDVILDTDAVAYEVPNDEFKSQFTRHIRDGAGHYQAIAVFWRLLLPRKGSFVHISHRVIKWIVPFLLILLYVSNALLIPQNWLMTALFLVQTLAYIALILYYLLIVKRQTAIGGLIGKLFLIFFYFMSVNLSLLLGCVRLVLRQQKGVWETQR